MILTKQNSWRRSILIVFRERRRLLWVSGLAWILSWGAHPSTAESPAASAEEVITYDIKKLNVKVGSAALTVKNHAQRRAVLVTFTATALNFSDEEKITLDSETFLPITVERNLNLWGKKERIVETYDHAKGEVKIVKQAGKRTTEQIIRKQPPIENIYGFIYRFRQHGKFNIGETMRLHLPTKDIEVKVMEMTKVRVREGERDAFFLQSDPRQYSVWFDTSPSRIPLRIDGAVGLARTAMVLRDYQITMPEGPLKK